MQNDDWTRKKNITKKWENQKLKKIKNIKKYLKGYIKIGKIIYRVCWYWNHKTKISPT